jgi:TatD DNase family protein
VVFWRSRQVLSGYDVAVIDSHCHLADKAFAADLPAVLQRAAEAGVDKMIAIADTLEEGEKCLALAEKYDHIFCTVGVHPHAAKTWVDGDVERLRAMATSSWKVRAIGEIGLDYHYDFSPRESQHRAFRSQLELAKELKLPAVVHCREAVGDVWQIADGVRPEKLVIHCCTEAFDDVARFVERGWFLSFTGIATYPKSETIRETIRRTPIGQLMIETDAPYLSPVPHRGKRNEPAFVAEVLACIAREKEMDLREADAAITRNTVEFFGL